MLKICHYENWYGYKRRFEWISKQLDDSVETCLDVGCGTGMYLTLPLIVAKPTKKIYGVDNADCSIIQARLNASKENVDKDVFFCSDIFDLTESYDAVICSEVLEHIPAECLNGFVRALYALVKKDGKLIVTVPNGGGAFEKGVVFRKQHQRLFKFLDYVSSGCKTKFFSGMIEKYEEAQSVSLSNTPHVNFFKKNDLIKLIEKETTFVCTEFSGSCMFSGCFVNLLPPFQVLLKINDFLGALFPVYASGYYFVFTRR